MKRIISTIVHDVAEKIPMNKVYYVSPEAKRLMAARKTVDACSCGPRKTRDQQEPDQPQPEGGGDPMAFLTEMFDYMRDLDARLTVLEQAEQGENPQPNGENNGGAGADGSNLGGGGLLNALEPTPVARSESDPMNSEGLVNSAKGGMRKGSPDQHDWTVTKAQQDQGALLPYAFGLGASIGSKLLGKETDAAPAGDQLPLLGAIAEGVGAFEPIGQAAVGLGLGAASALTGGEKKTDDDDPSNANPVVDPRMQQQGAGGDAATRATTGDGMRRNRYLAPRHAYNMRAPKIAAQIRDQVQTAQSRQQEYARNRRMAEQIASAYKKG
jgi:hypothetical protein